MCSDFLDLNPKVHRYKIDDKDQCCVYYFFLGYDEETKKISSAAKDCAVHNIATLRN